MTLSRTSMIKAVVGTALLGPAAALAQQDCDRACLEDHVDRYLEAVIDNDPSAAPLSDDVRFTENGQRLRVPDGLWNTMRSQGDYRIYIADEAAGQVAYMGNIEEDHREPDQGTPALLSLRLRIEDGEITEVEHFVARSEDAARRFEEMEPRPAFTEAVPDGSRMSREYLIATANEYFSGMEQNDGKHYYPFAEDCERLENGMMTTNAPVPDGQEPADPENATTYSAQWSCAEQFESGLLFFVNRIRDRRFVAVDEERGLVFAFGFFDHSGGEFRHGETPEGREVVAGPVQPWTWYIAELFKVQDGLLHEIEAFLERVPYGMNSGWSTWEQGLSSELQDVTFSDD